MDVYIIFTDTKTSLSKMIKAYTRHPYSHVSVAFGPELTEVYSFGRKNADNALNGGFVKEDMHNHLFQRAQCAVFKCTVDASAYKAMKDYVLAMERQHEKYKYNLSGLVGVVLKKGFGRENSFFCSQFVAEVLRQGGMEVSGKTPSLIMPRDIFCADILQFLYSGPLADYPQLIPKTSYLKENPILMEAL